MAPPSAVAEAPHCYRKEESEKKNSLRCSAYKLKPSPAFPSCREKKRGRNRIATLAWHFLDNKNNRRL